MAVVGLVVLSPNHRQFNINGLRSQALAGVAGEGVSIVRAPSLVGQGITLQDSAVKGAKALPKLRVVGGDAPLGECPNAGWLKGVCEHGTERWLRLGCKKRGCPVCGELRKRRIAWRIERGVAVLGGKYGAGWFVGTHRRDISKGEADRVAARFIRRIKASLSAQGVHAEWVHVRELTKAGRLHHNIIFAPWLYIPQTELSRIWQECGGGKRVWIERVGAGVGVEAAKLRQKLANYMSKYDQMVLYGRGISYSKGWPRLPQNDQALRKGRIFWAFVGGCSEDAILHWYETEMGHWCEAFPGEHKSVGGEKCDCFEFVDSS